MNKKIVLILFYSIFPLYFIFGQNQNDIGNPYIRNYSPKEYNSSNQIWEIIQDREGVLFFGNSNNIMEYDGKQWKYIPLSNKSMVRSISVDNKGCIYAGGVGDFGYLTITKTGQRKHISLVDKLKEKDRNFVDVRKIFPTSHGVYFCTRGKIFRYYLDSIYTLNIPITSSYYSFYDKIFIIDSISGINIINGQKIIKLPHTDFLKIKETGKIVLLPYHKNKILIITTKTGSFLFNAGILINDERVIKKDFSGSLFPDTLIKKFPLEADDFFFTNGIYSHTQISDSLYAFGTLGNGMILMDDKGHIVQSFTKKTGICDDMIFSLFSDNQKNVWVGTNRGISYIKISSKITLFSEVLGIQASSVNAIRHKGQFYAATFDGVYYLKENNTTSYKTPIFLPVREINTNSWALLSFHNELFAGTFSGLFQIKDSLAKKIWYEGINIYSLGQTIKFPNHIMLGLNGGFKAVELEFPSASRQNNNREYVRVRNTNDNLFKELEYSIREVESDSYGNLWLSTNYDGLIVIQFFENDISKYQLFHYDTSNGLPNNDWLKAYEYKKKIIVCTGKGMYQAVYKTSGNEPDYSTVRFTPFRDCGVGNFLDTIQVTRTIISKDKTWVLTGEGPYMLYKDKKNNYTWERTSFKEISVVEDLFIDEGLAAWFFGDEGIFRYDIKKKKSYNTAFSTLIRRVKINNDSVIFNGVFPNESYNIDSNYIVPVFFQSKKNIPKIEYQYNTILFDFSSPFFEHTDALEYQYILDGFEKESSAWEKKNSKEYTNLPHGSYCFRVKAKNIYGFESKEALYRFNVLPPWYFTWWANCLYIVLSCGVVVIIVKIYTRRLVKQKKKLEIIVAERTSEIMQKNIMLEKQKDEILFHNIQLKEQKEEIITQNEEIQQQKEEITAHRDQLQEMNLELEKLSIVASKTDNAVMIMKPSGELIWINEGFSRMFQMDIEQIHEKKGQNLLDISSNKDIKKRFDECILFKKSVIYESAYQLDDGRIIWTQTTLTPILDESENVSMLIAIDSDITKTKEAEQIIKKKNILITDSINYAKRIQDAILPSEKIVLNYFPEAFILFQPRDIVSGDFYWFTEKDDNLYIAVVDCTGHGVPGAFMSMIGNSLLNEIINKSGILKPSEILDLLNIGIFNALAQSGDSEQDDGMDITLCKINKFEKTIEFASAIQSLVLFDDHDMKIFEGDMYSIGDPLLKRKKIHFTNHSYTYKDQATIYLFTDGYADQIGEMKNKKFFMKNFFHLLQDNFSHPLLNQKENLMTVFEKWKGKNSQLDDILIIGLRIF